MSQRLIHIQQTGPDLLKHTHTHTHKQNTTSQRDGNYLYMLNPVLLFNKHVKLLFFFFLESILRFYCHRNTSNQPCDQMINDVSLIWAEEEEEEGGGLVGLC